MVDWALRKGSVAIRGERGSYNHATRWLLVSTECSYPG